MSTEIRLSLSEDDVDTLRSLLAWAVACGPENDRAAASQWIGYLGARWDAQLEVVAVS